MEDGSAIDRAYEAGKGAYASSARQDLQAAEDNASSEDSGTTAQAAEGGWKTSVTGDKSNVASKLKGSGKIKKALPLIGILLVIIVVAGALAFISQSFQVTAFWEQQKINDNKLSATVYTREENDTISRLKSTDPDKRLSQHLIDIFARHGLDYVEHDNGDGTVAKALIYNGDSTTMIAANSVKDTLFSALTGTGSVIDAYQDIASLGQAEEILKTAWFGSLTEDATAVHYDEDASLTRKRLGQEGNRYSNDSDNPSNEEIYQSLTKSHQSGNFNQTSEHTYRYEWDTWLTSTAGCVGSVISYKVGDTWYYDCWRKHEIENDDDINMQMSQDEMSTALSNRGIVAAFSSTPNYSLINSLDGSANRKSDSAIASAVSAMVKDKSLDFAFGMANAVDKNKAGDGGAEMSYFGTLLNTPAISYDADGNEYSTMAAAASTSFNSWFSDDVKVDPNNAIVKKYKVEDTLKRKGLPDAVITANEGDYENNYNNIDNTSSVPRSTENMKNGDDLYCLEELNPPHGKTACPGYGEIPESPYYIPSEAAEYIYALTSIDLVKDPAGEEGAVALNEGVQLLSSALLGQSSGTKGSADSVAAFYQMNQEYIAKLAVYERNTRSPFDATSKFTFLGSIVSSLLPLTAQTNSNPIFAAISSAFSSVISSVTSLTPSASAINTMDYLNSATSENCFSNDASEMVCDATGNPITIMEMDHMDDDMSNVRGWMIGKGYVKCKEEDGKIHCDITDEENDYAKWLLCTQNDSVVNINRSTEDQAAIGFWESVGNFFKRLIGIPITVKNQTSCGGNYNKDPELERNYKYFAQFTLDMRILAIQEETDEAPATAYFKRYYEEHPIDNSYAGRIARLSGLTKDEVVAVLDHMEYEVYIAHYHPETRYQFIDGLFTTAEVHFETDNPNDPFAVAAVVAKMTEYDELRSKNCLM